mmetsp:Transcript_10700/g.41819  ORF Transcript_10700/g.41819 Transcript_10700/m.41819 type:complete len:251 (+) Transcript_10700:3012-3764(+)
MDTRCFCPPERVTPRSPIMVMSRAGRISRSASSWETRRHFRYFSSSYGWPKRMLSLTVELRIQACWATYATRPLTFMSPVVCGTKLLSAESSVDLPQPTLPMTMVSEPGARSRSTPVNSNGGCSGSSAGTSTASGASSPFFSPSFLSSSSFFALVPLPGGPFLGSSGFFCTAGHLKSPAATRTRPGSDMSGSTFSFSSWSKKAPRRCTALSALSKLVSKNGTRMSGKRSMLNSARAVYAVDAVSVLPASE